MKFIGKRVISCVLVIFVLVTMVTWGDNAFSAAQCDGLAILTWDEEPLDCIDPWTHFPGTKVDCKTCFLCNCYYRCCTA